LESDAAQEPYISHHPYIKLRCKTETRADLPIVCHIHRLRLYGLQIQPAQDIKGAKQAGYIFIYTRGVKKRKSMQAYFLSQTPN
jgi:hypothetical protein